MEQSPDVTRALSKRGSSQGLSMLMAKRRLRGKKRINRERAWRGKSRREKIYVFDVAELARRKCP